MNKDFALYEEALALKELGFDTECFCYYSSDGKLQLDLLNAKVGYTLECLEKGILAPTYQQAIRWFKKEHKLHTFIDIYPTKEEPERCWYMLRYMERANKDEDYMSGWFENEEKLEPSRLRKLIEIVKERDK